MVTRIIVVCVSLFVPQIAFADTIVTWVGEGAITSNYQQHEQLVVPPVGTPISLTMTFDPASAVPTPAFPPWGPGCMMVTGVSASVNIGGYVYAGSDNLAFTSAALPGTNCTGTDFTQFSLHRVRTPPGAPWHLNDGGVLLLSYVDLLVQDAFPSAPTTPLASLWYDTMFGDAWGFRGTLSLAAVAQPAPVPEPATMLLFASGLAAVGRRVRNQRRAQARADA